MTSTPGLILPPTELLIPEGGEWRDGDRKRVTRSFRFDARPEVRTEGDGKLRFKGYASVFDQPSQPMGPGGTREYIAFGAFDITLARGPRVLMLHNHDANLVMSSTDNATLALAADNYGLGVDALWAPTTYAADVGILYRDGYLQHMSFGFWIVHAHREERNGELVIVIDEIDLDGGDVSTVAYPAYLQTSGEMRHRGIVAVLRTAFPELGLDDVPELRDLPIGATMAKHERTIPSAPPAATLKQARFAGARRDLNGWTFSDLWPLLDEAIVDHCSSEGFNAYWYVWIVDMSDTWVVYWDSTPGSAEAGYWQADYTVDAAGKVTLAEPTPVVLKTTYLPAPADDDTIETPPIGEPTEMSGDRASIIERTRQLALRGKVANADTA